MTMDDCGLNKYYFPSFTMPSLAKTWMEYHMYLRKVTKKECGCLLSGLFLTFISGRLWATKIIFTIPCISFWKAFRWKKNFWNRNTKSTDFVQYANFSRKSQPLKKIRHYKKFEFKVWKLFLPFFEIPCKKCTRMVSFWLKY